MNIFQPIRVLLAWVALGAMLPNALATSASPEVRPLSKPLAEPQICVFDLLGTKGPIFNLAQEYALEGRKNGYPFKPVVYTNEAVAAKDFEIGKCDGLVATGIRTRRFNSFAGSLDAIGALPNYQAVLLALKSMGSPQLQPVMVQGDYEVGGVLPFGAAYIFVKDRDIDSLAKAAGKRVAALAHDESQRKLIEQVGAQPVSAEVNNLGTMFNNGAVDIIVAPSIAYAPLELYKGIRKRGGVIDLPVAMVTYQIILRKSRFESGSGQKLREYVAQEMPKALAAVEKIDKDIPAKAWLSVAEDKKPEYHAMMREARIQLSREGVYDGCALRLMHKVRCAVEPTLGECNLPEQYKVPAVCPVRQR
ncbi:putative solute-binding protein [Limnobacter sp.]|uniref:putative solute-binding protein n=1 Tax=Limnobacter sp. TaxID=2003368 RepID=UPI003516F584